MTLEELQEQNLQLQQQLEDERAQRETLSQNNEQLTRDLENARSLNQKLWERLPQGTTGSEGGDPSETDPVSCVDFAKSIYNEF